MPDEFIKVQNIGEKFFLDIHGMVDHEDFELAVGTGLLEADAYQKAVNAVGIIGEKYGLRKVLNHPHYSGIAGMKALTARMQMFTGKPLALQLEIGREYRDFQEFPKKVIEKTVPFLQELVLNLEKQL